MDTKDQKELIDSVYQVALQPDRYDELTDIWQERLSNALIESDGYAVEFSDDFQRSLQILETITYDEAQAGLLPDNLRGSRFAVLAVSGKGKIIDGNLAAETAFGELGGVSVSDLPFDDGSIQALQSAIMRCAREKGALQKLIRAVKRDSDGQALVSVRYGGEAAGRPPIIILQTSEFVWPDHLLPKLQSAFSLTQAEAEITRLVTEGKSLSKVADVRGSSLATVRTQMRSVFQKTETHSQTELVRMAIAFVTLYDTLDAESFVNDMPVTNSHEAMDIIYPRQEDRHLLDLPDGRQLDYSIVGDPDGEPILHISPVFWADFWPARNIQKLVQRGFKVIAPARPGYFRSSICPEGGSPVQQYSQDVQFLLLHLGIKRISILARGMGVMFAYELARMQPALIKGMVLVAPELPLRNLDVYKDVSARHRFILTATLKYPKLLELYISAGRIFYKRVTPRTFIEKNFAEGKQDFYLFDDHQIMEALQRGLAVTYTAGTKAILQSYQDVKFFDYDEVLKCQTPATAIVGTSQASPRLMVAKKLIFEGAKMKLVYLERIAEFCFYSELDLILDELAEYS